MIAQILGWTGAAALVVAYGALTARRWTTEQRRFHAANLLGAVLLGISSAALGAWFSVALNVFWGVVALAGLRPRKNA